MTVEYDQKADVTWPRREEMPRALHNEGFLYSEAKYQVNGPLFVPSTSSNSKICLCLFLLCCSKVFSFPTPLFQSKQGQTFPQICNSYFPNQRYKQLQSNKLIAFLVIPTHNQLQRRIRNFDGGKVRRKNISRAV